jgi:prepilin-type N-terminal cleavage/methylation domain-containing protein
MKNVRAFTLIELMLVISIIAILGASTTPFLSRFILQTNYDSVIDKLTGSIRKAQEYAMDGKNGATWGICKSTNNIRLYSGSCNSPIISENFSIPTTVTVSGLTDTTFNLRGEPSMAISVTVNTILETASIQLNSAGGITIN